MQNLIPLPYRRVSVQRVPIRLDEPSIRDYLLGKEAYRWTDYIVLHGERGQTAVAHVEKVSTTPLFSPITAVEVVALPEACIFMRDPQVDTGNPSAMAAKAAALGLSSQATLVVEGLYSHVNFLHHPAPLAIRVVEEIPPEPPKLLAMAQQVLSYADLPPVLLTPELTDLSGLAHANPAPAHLFPCRASGLEGPGPTFYLDERPPRQEWLLIGCERSRQIHRHFYGDEPPYIEMCPRHIPPAGNGPTLLKCCLLEQEIEVGEHSVVVPWGATLQQVEEGLRALVAQHALKHIASGG